MRPRPLSTLAFDPAYKWVVEKRNVNRVCPRVAEDNRPPKYAATAVIIGGEARKQRELGRFCLFCLLSAATSNGN